MRLIVNGQPIEAQVAAGESLYALLARLGYQISAPCGGGGRCGKCRVTCDNPLPPNETEQRLLDEASLRRGVRLACKTMPMDGLSVRFEAHNTQRAQIATAGVSIAYEFSPAVGERWVRLEPPALHDQTADLERLRAALHLPELTMNTAMLRALPAELRRGDWQLGVALMGSRAVAWNPRGLYGVAVDIGTTTLASYLVDLRTGEELAVASSLNPQKAFGDDVISRCDAARGGSLEALQRSVAAEIDRLVGELCQRAGVDRRDVCHMTLAGNTVMMHLCAGVSPENIAQSPFVPAWTGEWNLDAADLGVHVSPGAVATLLPCVAGYVGADTVAAMTAAGLREDGEPSLLIDIGTNGEIALAAGGALFACSTAAGPAFEGAHIRNGMGGVTGAINHATVGEDVRLETIGGAPARGICGSGLLDLIAGFLDVGVIDDTGRIDEDAAPAWLTVGENGIAVDAEHDIWLTRRDIREVQLAKGAIAAGVQVLLREAGVAEGDVRHVYLAGGFGSYMDKRSACRVGLIPMSLMNRTEAVGNGSGAGAKAALLSKEARDEASRLSRAVKYVELSARQDFQDLFMDYMMF